MINSVFIATSIDGFIARRDGTLDFLDSVQLEGEDYGFAAFMNSVDAIVMGRATWDVVRAMKGPWAYAGKRMVVLTTRPASPVADETFFSGTIAELNAKLTGEGRTRVYVDGGKVIQAYLDADLIDELTISTVPVRLGAGIPLFATGVERKFKLTNSRAWLQSGLVQTSWTRRRP